MKQRSRNQMFNEKEFWDDNFLLIYFSDWMMMISFFASIILLIPLHIKRRESPTNLILLAAFVSNDGKEYKL